MDHNLVGESGRSILWPAIRASKLTYLSLINTESASGQLPEHNISFSECMEAVFMNDNQLGREGAERVLICAQDAQRLNLLDVSGNNIRNDVVDVIAEVFKVRDERQSSAVLESPGNRFVALNIILHNNRIGKEALQELATKMPAG